MRLHVLKPDFSESKKKYFFNKNKIIPEKQFSVYYYYKFHCIILHNLFHLKNYSNEDLLSRQSFNAFMRKVHGA